MGTIFQELRYVTRALLKRPQFAATAVLTLALGIGGVTAIFSVVYGVLLKPLPFDEPEQLVGVYHRAPGLDLPEVGQGPATYFTYRDSNRVFEDLGAWDLEQVSITGHGEAE
ncbi:MAG: ABC transporter permease, partial [Thermoanaerobaculia bacterium]